jgi:hypothetical protein
MALERHDTALLLLLAGALLSLFDAGKAERRCVSHTRLPSPSILAIWIFICTRVFCISRTRLTSSVCGTSRCRATAYTTLSGWSRTRKKRCAGDAHPDFSLQYKPADLGRWWFSYSE